MAWTGRPSGRKPGPPRSIIQWCDWDQVDGHSNWLIRWCCCVEEVIILCRVWSWPWGGSTRESEALAVQLAAMEWSHQSTICQGDTNQPILEEIQIKAQTISGRSNINLRTCNPDWDHMVNLPGRAWYGTEDGGGSSEVASAIDHVRIWNILQSWILSTEYNSGYL
jgi:hypothetical protein